MLNKEDILALAWEHSEGGGKCYTFTEESLFEFLKELKKEQAPAQDEQHPVGAEWAVPVVCYLRAFQDGTPHWTEDCVCEDAVYPNHDGDETYSMPMVRQSDHLATLSAVTAERDMLRKDAQRYRWLCVEGNWVARMFGKWRAHTGEYGENNPTDWFDSRDSAIDSAMAAKDANKN